MRDWFPKKLKAPGQTVAIAVLGETVFVGLNDRETTHPRHYRVYSNGYESYSTHAEQRALDQLPYDSNKRKVRLYVMRFLKNGKLAMARPCPHCQQYLTDKGIKLRNVFYTNEQGNWERFK